MDDPEVRILPVEDARVRNRFIELWFADKAPLRDLPPELAAVSGTATMRKKWPNLEITVEGRRVTIYRDGK